MDNLSKGCKQQKGSQEEPTFLSHFHFQVTPVSF